MLFKVLSGAILAAVLSVAPSYAQSVRDLKGPAELPSASFKGQQYVDSRGCVFLRAGYGGKVNWVPRVTRDRKQLCGYPASGGTVEVAEAAPKVVPQPVVVPRQPVATTAPLDTVASIKTPPLIRAAPTRPAQKVLTETYVAPVSSAPRVVVQAAPRVVLRPRAATEAAAATPRVIAGQGVQGVPSASGLRLACPADMPIAQRFEMHGGGSRIMCTNGDGTVAGLSLPRYVDGNLGTVRQGYDVYTSTKSSKIPPAPEGFKPAWKDDRLNVNRGKRTAEGEFQQDEIWTRTIPSELREGSKIKRKPLVVIVRPSSKGQADVSVSSKSAAPTERVRVAKRDVATTAKATRGGVLVQVGTFGVAANADGAASRLSSLGLPVARSKINKGGKAMQIVFAGPFPSTAQANEALRLARRAGFGDAILR